MCILNTWNVHSKPPSHPGDVLFWGIYIAVCFLTELLGPRGALDCGGNAVCCCFTKPGLGKQWSCVCAKSTQKPNNRLQQSGWDICGTVSKYIPNFFSVHECVFGRSHKWRICSLLKESIYPCSFSEKLVYFVLRVLFCGNDWPILSLAKIIW